MNPKHPCSQPSDTVIERPTLILKITEDGKYIGLHHVEMDMTTIFTADEAEEFAGALLLKVRRIRQLATEAPTNV